MSCLFRLVRAGLASASSGSVPFLVVQWSRQGRWFCVALVSLLQSRVADPVVSSVDGDNKVLLFLVRNVARVSNFRKWLSLRLGFGMILYVKEPISAC